MRIVRDGIYGVRAVLPELLPLEQKISDVLRHAAQGGKFMKSVWDFIKSHLRDGGAKYTLKEWEEAE